MGWTYNTVNPNAPTNAPTIVAVGVCFTALSLLVVCLRVYVRVFMIRAFAVDDWTILGTWFMSAGFLIVTTLQTKWGLGLQHLTDMPDQNFFNFGLLQFAGAPFYITSIFGFKLSLLLSFLRIAVEKKHRIAIIVIIVACTAFNFSFLMAQINLCSPVAKQWDATIKDGSCLVAVPMYTTMASLTIVFDVIIMLTPFPMLLKSQLQRRKKAVILGLFSLGIFITIIQIIRILTIKSLANAIDSSQLIMWSMVENNLGIIVASIPTLSPLVRSFRERSSANRSKGGGGGGGGGARSTSYALQSIPRKGGHGHVVLGSGKDQDAYERYGEESDGSGLERDGVDRKHNLVVVSGGLDNSSEEFIFGNINMGGREEGIQKKTEISVTVQRRGEST